MKMNESRYFVTACIRSQNFKIKLHNDSKYNQAKTARERKNILSNTIEQDFTATQNKRPKETQISVRRKQVVHFPEFMQKQIKDTRLQGYYERDLYIHKA